MPTATSRLSVNSLLRAGMDSTPQSGPVSSPAKKLSPTSCTPASATAPTKESTAWSDGTGSAGHGHQNSTARKPASYAADGRSSRGSSAKSSEQLTE
jgi:hypothetical protein